MYHTFAKVYGLCDTVYIPTGNFIIARDRRRAGFELSLLLDSIYPLIFFGTLGFHYFERAEREKVKQGFLAKTNCASARMRPNSFQKDTERERDSAREKER